MTDPESQSIEVTYDHLTSIQTNAAEKERCVQERTLDLVPRLVDQMCLPTTPDPASKLLDQSSHILRYLLENASPKELSLSLETELERAIDEIAECFVVDEDLEIDVEEQVNEEAYGSFERKTLESVSRRVCVALNAHRRVLDRLTFKTSKAGILVIEGFRQRLDDFLIDMIQALNEGESISPLSCVELCTAVASWCRQAFSWATNLALAPEEADLLRVSLANVLLKYLVMLHSRMGLLMLERGYSALYPETFFSKSRQNQASTISIINQQTECRNTIVEALGELGIAPKSYSRWMHREDNTSFDDRLVFFPIAALILTSWRLVDELETPQTVPEDTRRPDDNTSEILSISMPLLGSALNGLAKDGAHLWIWHLVSRMKGAQQHADLEEVSMLLELLMPNLAGDSSEASRYALHRLMSTLISLVPEAKGRIVLYQQLISAENPFLSVRLSSLALLREEIAAAMRLQGTNSIVHDDTFWSKLAPLVFVLSTADIPLPELPLEAALQDRVIPWSIECAKILLLIFSCGSQAGESCRAYVEKNQSMSNWILPLEGCLARWEGEASSDHPDDMDTSVLLYSLQWTLEQVESKLGKKDKIEESR